MDSAPALIEHMLALRLMLAVVLLPASYSFVGTGLVPSAICVSARDNGCMALLQAFRVRVRTSDCRLFYQATPEARPDEVSFGAGLPREELDCDNDAEATHLWSKLPQSLRAGYQYVRVLGRGSFGIVVLAQQRRHIEQDACSYDALVAVKLVRAVYGAEPLAMREGLVQQRLSRESLLIPACFDYGISKGVVYIVQEYIKNGIPLDKVLDDFGPLSPSEVAHVGEQVTEALCSIHNAGYVYRDVKPQNILRCGSGRNAVYRLIDYGSTVGVHGCLFGGLVSQSTACFVDDNPEETNVRLRALFSELTATGSNTLSRSNLVECFRAVGLSEKRAKNATNEILATGCNVGDEGNRQGETEEIALNQFVAAFDELVKQQDKGLPAGTAPFMAPEQFLAPSSPHVSSQEPFSQKSDIYGLGITLFRLMTGKFPIYPQMSERSPTMRHLLDSWATLHSHNYNRVSPRVSEVVPIDFRSELDTWEKMDKIIANAVEKDSGRRPNAAVLHTHFKKLLRKVGHPRNEGSIASSDVTEFAMTSEMMALDQSGLDIDGDKRGHSRCIAQGKTTDFKPDHLATALEAEAQSALNSADEMLNQGASVEDVRSIYGDSVLMQLQIHPLPPSP